MIFGTFRILKCLLALSKDIESHSVNFSSPARVSHGIYSENIKVALIALIFTLHLKKDYPFY